MLRTILDSLNVLFCTVDFDDILKKKEDFLIITDCPWEFKEFFSAKPLVEIQKQQSFIYQTMCANICTYPQVL